MMSPNSGGHPEQHSELVDLYVLGALAPSDVSVAEAQISSCQDCVHEIEMLRAVIDALVSSPADLLRPSPSLWGRVAERIEAAPGADATPGALPRWQEPEWKELAAGLSCKLLATDTEQNRVSLLVRLAPGVDYPPHRHAGFEELHVLDGELVVNDRKLYPGDYLRAEAGSIDRRVWSQTGCTCVLVTSLGDVIL